MNEIFLSQIIEEEIFNNFSKLTSIQHLRDYFLNESLAKYRLTRHSKTYVVDYFNIRFFYENNLLNLIQINFENKQDLLIKDDLFSDLDKDDTIKLLHKEGWSESKLLEAIIFTKDRIRLNFSEEDLKLHLLSMRVF